MTYSFLFRGDDGDEVRARHGDDVAVPQGPDVGSPGQVEGDVLIAKGGPVLVDTADEGGLFGRRDGRVGPCNGGPQGDDGKALQVDDLVAVGHFVNLLYKVIFICIVTIPV